MVSTIEIKFKLKFALKSQFWGISSQNLSPVWVKNKKSGYFQSFRFYSSVLQTKDRNQYGFCLSDQLKNVFVCKSLIYGDFGSKFASKNGEK